MFEFIIFPHVANIWKFYYADSFHLISTFFQYFFEFFLNDTESWRD